VRLALTDLGIPNLKSIPDVFVSYRSSDVLIMRVVVDGGITYEYPLHPTGKRGIYTVRRKVGRGLELNYIQLEFANHEGGEFDLDAVRVLPIILKRTSGGR